MMKKILFAGLGISLLLAVFACQGRKKAASETEVRAEIDTIDTEVIDYNSYTEEALNENTLDTIGIQYVLLKIPQGDQQIRSIRRAKIYDGKIYVSDSDNKALIVYDMQGNPIAPVGRQGRGPEEYLNLTDFDVDSLGNIHIIDGNADRLLIFGPDYQFVSARPLPFQVDLIKCLPGERYLLELSAWNSPETANYQVVVCDKDLNILSVEKMYDKKLIDPQYYLSKFHFISVGEEVFFNRSVDEYVHVFSSEGKYKRKYYYDLGTLRMPLKYRTNIRGLGPGLANYRALLEFHVVTEGHAYGTMYDRGVKKDYVIDRNKKIKYTREWLSADLIGDLISISDGKIVREIANVELFGNHRGVPSDSVSHVLSLSPLL